MRTATAKITDEEYEAFNNWCQSNNSTINETLGNLIRQILEGKIKPRPTGLETRIPFCPQCGFILFPNFGQGTLNCLRCGFFAQTPGPEKWQRGDFKIE